MYIFCESLTQQETNIFINNLKLDFLSKKFSFIDFKTDYLETYLLQCFSAKYIKRNDFSNLISVLKRMDLWSKAEILQSVVEMQMKRTSPSNTTENRLIDKRRDFDLKNDENKNRHNSLNSSEIVDRSVVGETSIVKTVVGSDCYRIDPQNVGICMIINQEEFHMPADDSFMVCSYLFSINLIM